VATDTLAVMTKALSIGLALVLLAPAVGAAKPAGRKGKKKAERTGSIIIKVSVPGARVELDGNELGLSPVRPVQAVSVGPHQLRVSKLGFSEHRETIQVLPAKTSDVKVELAALFAVLTVEANAQGARILLDGKPAGDAPLSNKEVLPGEHTIQVTAEGYLDYETKIRAVAGEAVGVSALLLAKPPEQPPPGTDKTLAATPVVADSPAAAVPPDAPLSPVTQPAAGGSPWYKKWWVWAAAGVVVAGATVGILAATGQLKKEPQCEPTPQDPCVDINGLYLVTF
jgi:hypothetical protein